MPETIDVATATGATADADAFTIAGRTLRSRLLLGTGGFTSHEILAEAITASGAEIVTVALRRVDPGARGSLIDVIAAAGVELLPNTAGCHTARDAVDGPVVLDAGIGTASDATLAMEIGCDAVLAASAIARAQNPVRMARALRAAVQAGRLARTSGRIPRRLYATASTPDEGLPELSA